MIQIYTEIERGQKWIEKYQKCRPVFACMLGFTATGLISGISAAGATPNDRKHTAIADAEFLINGSQFPPKYPLPPLTVGASPVFISRAVVETLNIPVYLFNAGLPYPPAVPFIDLGGIPANCLTSGKALPLETVRHLFAQGMKWGEKLATEVLDSYLILGECVVGGTTTALAILTGLGIEAAGKVNSSHPQCNHAQKWSVVREGLEKAGCSSRIDPFTLVAAVGDPMQIVVAGMAIAASRQVGVMLAGGTQMLAVYALMQAIIQHLDKPVNLEQIVVGTTRWVAEDPTGDTVGLAVAIANAPLLATQLSFANSSYPQLQAYERGYVKEGVGAGGCAIAAYLYQNWINERLVGAIEALIESYYKK
ncbi:MAG: TIGR00303 family protein [Hydrococcus sp. C42_A2020_068]|uniref:nicotinate mononucleotide-dependent phosphoribosyltransferase CobT n=1 Tax=Pleurocapsa sp. PCC 7327 TaxID=118163 RepID=UPI00029F89EC|nr:TIGR00303 family protein [Pleurocapsa sp. PCC 7327]AFY75820.1 TIGR00303 family protein [Pleurocapsa sp. PCC 7327]MBF2020402.1 TIGR00303 family protein [Hydrococcus sp. C42_A2020_068]